MIHQYGNSGNDVVICRVGNIKFKFKALFRVDINHTYNTSSNELLKSTMVYNNTYNHTYPTLQITTSFPEFPY
jgi:hypothetical protein